MKGNDMASNDLVLRCESPAEVKLLHYLRKGYHGEQHIRSQVEACGYRIDFVTSDRVAWEIDGKDYHDAVRDNARDQILMRSGKFAAIIRIPAGAITFYYNACVSVFAYWCKGFQCRSPAIEACRCVEYFKALQETWEDQGASWSNMHHDVIQMNESDAFSVNNTSSKVGGALSFISGWEHIVDESELPLLRHQFEITRRMSVNEGK